jgi:hypothetical protein
MSDVPLFRACLICGKLMTVQADSKQVYCSPECSRENLCCPVCRRFFEKGSGVTPAEGPELCSPECARTEPKYDHLFKEQP